VSQRNSYVPQANVRANKWFQQGNEGSSSHFKKFEVSSLTLRRGGTTEGLRKGYYGYQNPPWVNRNMSKTQWKRHQRMKRDEILAMHHKNAVRPLVFSKINEGPPPRFEKKISIKD